ncbi:heavy metal translocating P-type ATPase [Ligilactobacillus sp. Marseille-Q7487]|jgi:Cd2+/Zn2+-exporting ATPase|uniref:heavy metal translocating P-type ATPase n=1 Tax=Ligilactobacillus sp. Marseille-Q7487 TaxID=3022128 RepID=UPI0015B38FF6|nr:heavy metal translocating P-type ATPase [Ligilactobacillus sp. Marseille-Q7487]
MKNVLVELEQDEKKVLLESAASLVLLAFGLVNSGMWQLLLCLVAYLISGFAILKEAIEDLSKGEFFGETLLMSIATLGAFAIQQYPEAVAVMLFYRLGEMFQDIAVKRSKRSITKLLDVRPQVANIKTKDKVCKVAAKDVAVGQVIEVKPGEKIALDGIVIAGESYLNTAALTGESTPRFVRQGQEVLSGMIALDGRLEVKVQKAYEDSAIAKILELVQNASEKKAVTENFITRFSKIYTPLVVLGAVILGLGVPLFTQQEFASWIYRALVFLVISCPCALVLSIPLSFFGGIGAASSAGVLVKGGNYLEALTALKIVAFDKTGTLTKGKFSVSAVCPSQNTTKEELLRCVATAEQSSLHPIGQCIWQYCQSQAIAPYNSMVVNELAGLGVIVQTPYGVISAGNIKLMAKQKIDLMDEQKCENTAVYVAKDQEFLGRIELSDTLKNDAKAALVGLKELGIAKLVMLTGDKKEPSQLLAKQAGIDEVYAQLLPAEKLKWLERFKYNLGNNEKIAFVGDGINDTPVLARADVGIAMGGLGADAAIEAADVVLMSDEPSALVRVIKIAKKTKRIVWENIALALCVKGFFLLLGAFGIATMWEAVFSDVGVTLLAVLNALRLLYRLDK